MKMKLIMAFCFSLSLCLGLLRANETSEEVFTRIYDQGTWGFNEEGRGFSGGGSTVHEAKPYMEFLVDFLIANEIHSVVDVGCGDWTFSQYINWDGIQYTGYDVVKSVIERNIARFPKPNVRFIHDNPIQAELPSADLFLCKDVLQHLPLEDIALLLKQTHKFKHCLITNDINRTGLIGINREIQRGDYREIDLSQPPFNIKGVKIFTYISGSNIKQVFYIKN